MNAALTTLSTLKSKTRIIVGLMSGTSLDGLDIALCEVKGHGIHTQLSVKHFTCVPYGDEYLNKVRPLFANPLAPLHEVTKANAWIAREHAAMVLASLKQWNIEPASVDILASHGQTVFHAPKTLPMPPNADGTAATRASATLQIGDGCHLAYITQILTVSDFRQKHIAASGEGAPLVPYADFLLFASRHENRILLNIGGIANFTYIPCENSFSGVVSADTGPGNTLMDVAIRHAQYLQTSNDNATSLPTFNHAYDQNGDFAAKGIIDETLLSIFNLQAASLNDAYLGANKSTGQESYHLNFMLDAIQMNQTSLLKSFPIVAQSFCDLLATLTMFTAQSVSKAINKACSQNLQKHGEDHAETVLYVSGGGVHNLVLRNNIQQCMPNISVKSAIELGIDPDAKEAALFAVLANQTLFGTSDVFTNSDNIPATCFGKISLP